jgi:CBS domain-containing protein
MEGPVYAPDASEIPDESESGAGGDSEEGLESTEELMKVQEVMTAPARSCRPSTTIVEAARTMWDNDCGSLPVLDEDGAPAGIITDRDICMALARKNRFPGNVAVREVMSAHPFVCQPDDEVGEALATMAARQVRRLPVVNGGGRLVGIVSLSDIAAASGSGARAGRGADNVHRKVAETLLKICAPRAEKQFAAALEEALEPPVKIRLETSFGSKS